MSEDQSQYCQCKLTFEFDNLLYKHFRQSFTCLRKTFIHQTFQKFIILIIIKNNKDLQKSFANIIKIFFANIIKKSFEDIFIKLFAK